MIIPIELRFKADKDSKSAFRTDKTIKSHDVNSVEFHISIEGLELTDNHTAKILSIFHSSKSQVNVDCEIVEGKIVYKPDTNLISRHEHVTNYVYVYNGNQSLDVCEFLYVVDLSKIDETSLEVKEVYDQSYSDLLAGFEQALEDYKLTLPQADSVRAEIDEMLNQFSEDSQAKLSLINEAEESRVQAEGQRESAESSRVQAESQRVSAESSRVSAESERVLAEDERENAEAQRKTDHANRSAELDGKADKVVLKNLLNVDSIKTDLYFHNYSNDNNVTLINSHKYYVYFDIELLYGEWGKSIVGRITASDPGHIFASGLRGLGVSDITTYTGETSAPSRFRFFGTGGVGEVEYRNVVLLDLTEAFGAGNEPTKEEMDELIKVTGYIDGEYALNNKEMLIWTLALIRRNKNAIVALGGA